MMSAEQKDFTKLGIVYAAMLIIFCNVIAADWQNDEIFYALGIYPYGLGVIYWPLMGCLVGSSSLRHFRFVRRVCLSVSAFYTYSITEYAVGEGEVLVWHLWRQSALQAVLLASYLVGGQVAVGSILWRRVLAARGAI